MGKLEHGVGDVAGLPDARGGDAVFSEVGDPLSDEQRIDSSQLEVPDVGEDSRVEQGAVSVPGLRLQRHRGCVPAFRELGDGDLLPERCAERAGAAADRVDRRRADVHGGVPATAGINRYFWNLRFGAAQAGGGGEGRGGDAGRGGGLQRRQCRTQCRFGGAVATAAVGAQCDRVGGLLSQIPFALSLSKGLS